MFDVVNILVFGNFCVKDTNSWTVIVMMDQPKGVWCMLKTIGSDCYA